MISFVNIVLRQTFATLRLLEKGARRVWLIMHAMWKMTNNNVLMRHMRLQEKKGKRRIVTI